ncbi:TonB-dependent receptor [Phenylobacterium sp. Root700]|uniref:TonB-dependent receptor n=1 Tax=Phenylobacterium sp. Root700 TaxID=1736591 RepID=UPI0006FF9351|nr:TonB-dependent receptor [Phenylobacterium sp. Root700]KRB44492.1 TonB-dependent receptor [Phenylobacterium sp. Root700]
MKHHHVSRAALLSSTVFGVALLIGAPAAAQEAALVEEVTVTAQKRAQDVLDVGGTLDVVSAGELASRRIEQVRDLATFSSNLDIKEQVPGAMPILTIRGVGLDDFSSTNNPSAGVYVDEVYLASLAQMSFDLFDLERVELLKGPQGTLYGRNSTAGALNIITAKPSTSGFSARAAGSYGNFKAYDLEGMVNLPLSDTFALRFAGKTIQQDEGYWYNRKIASDIGRRDLWLGRVQARWTPNDDLDVNLKVEGQRSRSELGQGEFFGVLPSPSAPGVACPGQPACTDFFGYSDRDGDPFKGDWSGGHFYNIDQVGTALKVDYRMGWATLTSVTGYANFQRSFYIDTDATPLRQTDFIQTDKIHQLSEELRLAGSTERLEWLVGGFYSTDRVRVYNPGFLDDLFNTETLSFADQKTKSAAMFANGEWKLGEQLSLITGLRYTWEEKTDVGGTDDLALVCPGSALTGAPCGSPPIRIASVDAKIKDTNWSWKLGLNWKLNPLTLLYASASQGVKSGGFFSGVATSSAQLEPYDPETLLAFEAGWKTRIPGAGLQLSASVFYYDYSDIQTFIRDTSGALPIQRLGNVGEAELYGADLDVSWRPAAVDGLTLQAGLGLLHTELGAFAASAGVVPAGNKLPNAPEVTFNASAQYDARLNDAWTLRLQGGTRYSDGLFKDALNDPLLRQDSYWSWDGRVALLANEQGWELAVWGKNLGDEQHLVQGVNNGALGVGFRTYNAPRTYGVSISKSW